MSSTPPATATVVMLHGLGLSGRFFDGVATRLADGIRAVAPDLPGFGAAAPPSGTRVDDTVDAVAAGLRDQITAPWVLVGHSMGGKIASRLIARIPELVLPMPAGVVLLAPSPPTPEPMSEEKRAEMTAWADQGHLGADAAATFLRDNTASPPPPEVATAVIHDLRRCDPTTWRAWFADGSREDLSDAIGAIDLPATILGGTADADLGAAAQPRLHRTVYPRARYVAVEQGGHLLPAERPDIVADEITGLVHTAV